MKFKTWVLFEGQNLAADTLISIKATLCNILSNNYNKIQALVLPRMVLQGFLHLKSEEIVYYVFYFSDLT